MATSGLATTFSTLQESQNDAALALLVEAMNVPIRAIHEGALSAILGRRSSSGHNLILRRFHEMDEPYREMVRKKGFLSPKSIRDALLGSDRQVCMNGCRVILWFREYEMVSTLLTALYDSSSPNEDLISDTFFQLIQTLSHDWLDSEEQAKALEESGSEAEPEAIHEFERQQQKILRDRERVLDILREGMFDFGLKHRRVEPLRGLLLLADATEPMFQKILDNPRHPMFASMMNLLAKTEEKNVTRLLLSSYTEPNTLKSLLAVAANRSDDEFISELIFLLRNHEGDTVKKNLRQIETISWIDHLELVLGHLSEEEQLIMFHYLMGTRISNERHLAVVQFFLEQGKLETRRLASEAIAPFTGNTVNRLLLKAINDHDPIVQANVIRTIRHRGIADMQDRVFALRNTPYEEVRKAIRETFSEYAFEHYLFSYDTLDDDARRKLGQLAYDIDDDTMPRLRKEFRSNLRNSRARAMAIVEVLDLIDQFENELLEMMDKEDSVLRMKVLELLAQIPTARVKKRIEEAADDPNESVANAAQRLLGE